MADNLNITPSRKYIDGNALTLLWNKITTAISNAVSSAKSSIKADKSYRGYHVVTHNVTSGGAKSITLEYNTYNIVNVSGSNATTINFTIGGIDNATLNDVDFTCEFVIEFISNSNITIGTPAGIAWESDAPFEWEAGHRYIISFIKNYRDDVIKAVYGKYPI